MTVSLIGTRDPHKLPMPEIIENMSARIILSS